ncbi:MAG TPA: 3'-5' exonuclease, partial [Spirochaetia bacterium]|nr:3'-5' exonuclease [Spirochaetia bacterium]
LIKQVLREQRIATDDVDLYGLVNTFSAVKTGRMGWSDETKEYKPIYESYLEHLRVYNAVDFDDLIILPIEIFTRFPDILTAYQERYRYIMVDEFQDTSLSQYRLMRLLAEKHRNICVVGDDDQSIYSWRGANYQNIVNFERDFPERKEIKLERNYRSTQNILTAANSLIAHNTNRKQKELWSGDEEGSAIEIFYPQDETKEAEFIAETIRISLVKDRLSYDDFGILVRTNSLTTAIEAALLASNIPYRVSGGTSFFQRKEIKDIIAYLRVIVNLDDDVNLLRIINTPRRGIGMRTLLYIREIAEKKNCSLYSAISAIRWAQDAQVQDKVREVLSDFLSLIEVYRDRLLTGKNMAETVRSLVEAIGYWDYLVSENQKNENAAKWKYKNISIFIDMMERWEKDPDTIQPNIFTYLNRITLITRDDVEEDEKGKVNLMTIHSAKGLEFDTVFVAGVEDNIIPHGRALEENEDNIEEERRLFYVAITRAKRKLYLTSCLTRRMMREIVDCVPSRFLDEMPAELIKYHEPEREASENEVNEYFAQMRSKLKAKH